MIRHHPPLGLIAFVALLLVASVALAACGGEGENGGAGQQLEEAVGDQVDEAVEGAADGVEEAVEGVGDEVVEAVEGVGDQVEEAVEGVGSGEQGDRIERLLRDEGFPPGPPAGLQPGADGEHDPEEIAGPDADETPGEDEEP